MNELTIAEQRPQEPHDRDGDDLLTIAEAADLLKVSTVTLSRWRRQGRLPTLKIGPRAVRIRRADLDLISQPYSGPVSSLDHPRPVDAPRTWSAEHGAPTAPMPAPLVQNLILIPTPISIPTERTMARATQLRSTILRRRSGDFLDPAGDDLGKLRDKRAKRRL